MTASALDHLELSSLLVPPEPGDELAFLFLTTFGLDLAVLGALLASTGTDELESAVTGGAEAYGVADLLAFTPFEAREGSGDAELLVLADAGGIQNSLKAGTEGLGRFLSRFVVPVRAERAGRFRSFFHPKLAVAGFKPAGKRGALRWRLLIGSKNITRGAAFELGTWLDSGAARRGGAGLRGESVLAAVQKWSVAAISREKQRRYRGFLRRLRRAGLGKAYFPTGSKAGRLVRSIRLHPAFDVPAEPREALVVTPFLNPGALPRMTGKSRGTVISNAFTAEDCAALAARGWTARRWRGGTWEHSVLEAKRFPSTLHAKMALCRGERGWQLYVGSGNATAGGKVRNRELGLVLDLEPVLAKRLHYELTKEAEPFLAEDAASAEDDDRERLRNELAEVTSAVTMERRDGTLRLTLDPEADLRSALPRGTRLILTVSGSQEVVRWNPGTTGTVEVPLRDEKPGLVTVTIEDGTERVSALLPFEGSERTVEALREATLPVAMTRGLAEARWKERILAVRGVTPAYASPRKKDRRKSRFSEPRRWVRQVTVEDLVHAATVAPERARSLLDPGNIRQVVFGGQLPPEGLVEAIRALPGMR